jgi:hypothetical protein
MWRVHAPKENPFVRSIPKMRTVDFSALARLASTAFWSGLPRPLSGRAIVSGWLAEKLYSTMMPEISDVKIVATREEMDGATLAQQ